MSAIKLLTTFDLFAFNWCTGLPRSSEIAFVSRQVSRLGDGGLYLLLGILLAVFEPQHGMSFLAVGILAYLIELPVYVVLKNTIKRDRPCEALSFDAYIVPSDKFSFPSGHAAAAFVFAGLVAYFYPTFSLLAYTLALMIGASRVLLGVHYPSDIAAGAFLGMACCALALSLMPVLGLL